MAAEKATAIVLRTVDFSESSLIVTLFSREFGKIEGLAKGARRIKGPFSNALDLLARIRVVFLRKSSASLDLLTEASIEHRFRPEGKHLAGLYGGYYVAELLNEMTPVYEPNEMLYDHACEVLDHLESGASMPLWVSRFEAVLLQMLGYLPSLDHCAECGVAMPLAGVQPGRVAFGHLDGGVLCTNCRPGKTNIAMVDAPSLRLIRQLADPDNWKWIDDDWSADLLRRLRRLLSQHMCHVLGKRPRLYGYVK